VYYLDPPGVVEGSGVLAFEQTGSMNYSSEAQALVRVLAQCKKKNLWLAGIVLVPVGYSCVV